MQIKVILNSGSEISVPSYALDYLIAKNLIKAFKRSDGWVRTGHDRIRDSPLHAGTNHGQDRRATDRLFVKHKS